MTGKDRTTVRELAARVAEIAALPVQEETRRSGESSTASRPSARW